MIHKSLEISDLGLMVFIIDYDLVQINFEGLNNTDYTTTYPYLVFNESDVMK